MEHLRQFLCSDQRTHRKRHVKWYNNEFDPNSIEFT